MRVYNLSKTVRDDVIAKLLLIHPGLSLRTKELKIAEMEDPSLAVIFDKEDKLYIGRKSESTLFPLLKDELLLPSLPTITVDSGAVKFVCNGANVMRPGITKIEGNFAKSDLVVVKEAKFGKAIAVGRAIVAKQDMESMTKGAAIENLHYVGDKFWNALKEIES